MLSQPQTPGPRVIIILTLAELYCVWQALRRTRLCSGASEDEVAEMQKVLEAWQTQAVSRCHAREQRLTLCELRIDTSTRALYCILQKATQQELIHASQQLRTLHSERAADKQALDDVRRQLEASRYVRPACACMLA